MFYHIIDLSYHIAEICIRLMSIALAQDLYFLHCTYFYWIRRWRKTATLTSL